MEILTSKAQLAEALQELRQTNKTIGFVPTMGALHAGHMTLIKIAGELTDVVVASIFVNPTQFNNSDDLQKYPRPVESDIKLLQQSKCNILFLPEVDEMYTGEESWNLDLGYLENTLEGKFRPGHYQGVTQIVKKLLDIANPDFVFLGQKDFQQVMVLEHMVKALELPSELVMCPIVRDDDGLALSSRNVHLSRTERQQALSLSKALFYVQKHFDLLTINQLKENAWLMLDSEPGVVPEYFEICDADTLLPTPSKDTRSIIALVAAKVGETRLIDNIILK
ncbi:pantoate--beta-alanine ligase [Paradesertivirga mongoliensis]|uniref:Pantothenate synthetase n=1 Tax=Paradesertivirga mongoliensis TaxID=2100740 RepID=A0ABW4ZHT2_9SPHI|nr:pantoate--beta-alanine ligase [Pedobacter mongoliensis]